MERKDVLLAALAATKRPFFPVHLQKALFLVDRKLPHLFAERYSFAPYDYGPFDSDVYSDASELSESLGLVEIGKAPEWRSAGTSRRLRAAEGDTYVGRNGARRCSDDAKDRRPSDFDVIPRSRNVCI